MSRALVTLVLVCLRIRGSSFVVKKRRCRKQIKSEKNECNISRLYRSFFICIDQCVRARACSSWLQSLPLPHCNHVCACTLIIYTQSFQTPKDLAGLHRCVCSPTASICRPLHFFLKPAEHVLDEPLQIGTPNSLAQSPP